ncbi:hypothetical protein [Pseudonocardia sp. GCM10023141]|uniref:hypothetical protein n=1 Tax=Pseudonocardia sp. GCM10023141 TaxID=3252653 RepID=UPI0036206E81
MPDDPEDQLPPGDGTPPLATGPLAAAPIVRTRNSRIVVAVVALVVCLAGGVITWIAGLGWFSVVLAVAAVFAVVDLTWTFRRRRARASE